VPPQIVKLINPILHYAWGSHHAIARLQGRPTPTQEPEAELWVGDHPVAPSRVAEGASTTGLADWIARDPIAVLGTPGDHLPFLVKLLAAARPLSVQVHPDAEQAQAGYARECRVGTPDAERSYRDANPKHELLVALSRFEALCGFREDAAIARHLNDLPVLAAIAAAPATEEAVSEPRSVHLFHRLQRLSAAELAHVIRDLQGFAASNVSVESELVSRLLSEHPSDPLAAAPLLLNVVVLEEGDALVVRPGAVHSYLSGTGLEVMTRSDNVIRAGLTAKHVDAAELRAITAPRAGPPDIRRAERDSADARCSAWPTGTDTFAVRAFDLAASPSLRRLGGRVVVVVCVEGAVRIDSEPKSPSGPIALESGEAALIPARSEAFQLTGSARTSRVFEVSSR
jgi:mannose-6-phosphate isomerase